MKKIDAEKIIEFCELLHRFQRVERVVHVPGENRYENDVEHSYLLAMTAWYIIDAFGLALDRDTVIRYALTHDLVEVYAGDTYAFTKDVHAHADKVKREEEAQHLLQKNFPEASSVHAHIERYEQHADPESMFVYALDKLMPLIGQYLQDGRSIQLEKLSFSEVVHHKRKKVAASPEIADALEQIIALMEKDKARFFGALVE